MKKIMIVEDDTVISEELYHLLCNSLYEVSILKDFQHAQDEILAFNPDLLLLDINIPYMNGQMLLKELRKRVNMAIIMVTSKSSEVDEVLSMSYGADDYIIKPYNPTILLLRISAIFRRMENKVDNWQYRDLTINFSSGLLKGDGGDIQLTKNEMIIFQYLLNNKGSIVTRDDLMTALWNNAEYVNDNALTVNISRLRSKLASLGISEAIETRKGQGYILL